MDAILGYIVALTLSMMSVAGFATWARLGVTNVQTAATASQMVLFDKAVQQYVQDNANYIAGQASVNTPYLIPASTLISNHYLPLGFSPYNLFGQRWQAQVLQPSSGQLQTLVTSQGGRPISDTKQLVQIAAQAGAQGGFIPYANQAGDAAMSPASARGAYGAWTLPMTNYQNPGSGHPASLLAFTNVQTNNSYLYRVSVPGQPLLNQMQTALDMGTNDINAAGNVSVTGVDIQNVGGNPTLTIGNGSLSFTNAGQLRLTADGGVAVKDKSGSYASLIAGSVLPATTATANSTCQSAGMIENSGSGALFCEAGLWTTLRPSLHRYTFLNSTTWAVPPGVKAAFVSIAGGGAGGVSGMDYGFQQPTPIISGASGGFVLNFPVNLMPGDAIPIVVGAGGPAGPYPNGGPAGTSSFGNYITCSGAAPVSGPPGDNEAEYIVGHCWNATGIISNGTWGQYVVSEGGDVTGGQTPLAYGSGGLAWRCNGCQEPDPTVGLPGMQGAVIVDVLY